MILDILKEVEDINKVEKEKQEADLEEEAETASTSQPVNQLH
jgi:hypothetical protein